MEKYVCIIGGPVLNDRCLFNRQFLGSPCEIGEQFMHLLVCTQFARNKLSRSQRIRN